MHVRAIERDCRPRPSPMRFPDGSGILTAVREAAPDRTTLVVMARAPVAGRCKTRLIPALGAEGAARLYEAMLQDVLTALERVPAHRRVVLATPEDDGVSRLEALSGSAWEVFPQRGGDLTERLTDGVERLGGGGPIVFFGSDAPTLRYEALRSALADLEQPPFPRAFIAPCTDGGYAAIGLNPPTSALFQRVPWSTEQVTSVTRERAREAGILLRELALGNDVDAPEDLGGLSEELRAEPSRAVRTAAWLRSAAATLR